jgi:hypothetical protein
MPSPKVLEFAKIIKDELLSIDKTLHPYGYNNTIVYNHHEYPQHIQISSSNNYGLENVFLFTHNEGHTNSLIALDTIDEDLTKFLEYVCIHYISSREKGKLIYEKVNKKKEKFQLSIDYHLNE